MALGSDWESSGMVKRWDYEAGQKQKRHLLLPRKSLTKAKVWVWSEHAREHHVSLSAKMLEGMTQALKQQSREATQCVRLLPNVRALYLYKNKVSLTAVDRPDGTLRSHSTETKRRRGQRASPPRPIRFNCEYFCFTGCITFVVWTPSLGSAVLQPTQ